MFAVGFIKRENLLRFFVSGIFFFFPASSFSAGFDDLTTPDINEGKWSFAFNPPTKLRTSSQFLSDAPYQKGTAGCGQKNN